MTTSDGVPVEIRDTATLNTEIFNRQFHLEQIMHGNRERIPERVVHAKGIGALGYFEVTHDVSKYTKADVFNGIGKKTPLAARFSTVSQSIGGHELAREQKSLVVKLYTDEGNLDLLGLNVPVFLFRDPVHFISFSRVIKRNPRTNLFDLTMFWDLVSLRPEALHTMMWLSSDFGIPNGYRKMDSFPIHTFEIYNKREERYYVRFNFRTEQGLDNLTSAEARMIASLDPDYYSRDLYNAVAAMNYPAWRLEMDVMSLNDIKNVDYDPFDVTRLWKAGTYRTVQIGRMVLNQRVNNHFKDVEQAAYNPGNLVPGILGPVDFLFKARRMSYADAQNYRLGVNHNKIDVNMPKYEKSYNRDGRPPVRENMIYVPNYYPNSFNGPIPYVDEDRPAETLIVLQSNAVDLEPSNYFYNHILESDAHRQRLADNFASSLENVLPNVAQRTVHLLTLIDEDLGRRVTAGLRRLRAAPKMSTRERAQQIVQCAQSIQRRNIWLSEIKH